MSANLYLSIPGILGEVTDPGFTNQIAVYSFSLGFSNPASYTGTGGSQSGKPQVSEISFLKAYDKSSPPLLRALCRGTILAPHTAGVAVVLSIVPAGGSGTPVATLTYSLHDVFVTSISDSGSSGGDNAPTQSVSLSFGLITKSYRQTISGTLSNPITVAYNQETNVTV